MPDTDTKQAPYYNVGLTLSEMNELILLIDDEPVDLTPVDEDLLTDIRSKLVDRRAKLRKRIRDGVYAS